MRVRGRSEFFLPSYTRCARSISMSRPFREGIHLERLTLSKPSAPSGNPTSLTLFLLLLSSISVIFSVSHSSWFLKSVTVLLSSRAAAWTESTRSRVCLYLHDVTHCCYTFVRLPLIHAYIYIYIYTHYIAKSIGSPPSNEQVWLL